MRGMLSLTGMTLKAVFVDRDGVINQEPGPILTPDQFVWIPGSIEAIARINAQGWLCIVVSNQSAFARGTLTQANFDAIHDKMQKDLQRHNAHIDGMYYCPHYPRWEAGWIKALCIPCECRKPGTKMFAEASRQHGFTPAEAVFIGDCSTDFEAAKRWGMRSIGVRTGYAGRDGKSDVQPDGWAEDLLDAATYLTTRTNQTTAPQLFN